jgi:hypothetical protein
MTLSAGKNRRVKARTKPEYRASVIGRRLIVSLAAGLLYELSMTGVAAQDHAWHCERRPTAVERKFCEKDRTAKPYSYQITTVSPGKGYSLCERIRENLMALPEPPNCGFSAARKYSAFFSIPTWETLDPWADPDYLWRIALLTAPGPYGHREVDTLSKDEWLRRLKARVYDFNLEVVLKRGHFDLNGDGVKDWVLAYGLLQRTCNPWGSPRDGYFLFMLKQDRKTIDTSMRASMNLRGHEQPFFSSIKDPRFPRSHTYRFYNTGAGDFTVLGSSSGGPVESSIACRFKIEMLGTKE